MYATATDCTTYDQAAPDAIADELNGDPGLRRDGFSVVAT
jgi:hypothetical protein